MSICTRPKVMTKDLYKLKREDVMKKTLKLMEIGKEIKEKMEKGKLHFGVNIVSSDNLLFSSYKQVRKKEF